MALQGSSEAAAAPGRLAAEPLRLLVAHAQVAEIRCAADRVDELVDERAALDATVRAVGDVWSILERLVDERLEKGDRLAHRAEDVGPMPDREPSLAGVRGLELGGEAYEVL